MVQLHQFELYQHLKHERLEARLVQMKEEMQKKNLRYAPRQDLSEEHMELTTAVFDKPITTLDEYNSINQADNLPTDVQNLISNF